MTFQKGSLHGIDTAHRDQREELEGLVDSTQPKAHRPREKVPERLPIDVTRLRSYEGHENALCIFEPVLAKEGAAELPVSVEGTSLFD